MGWCQLQAEQSCVRPHCNGLIVTAPFQCSDPWCWVPFASWAQPRPFSVIHPCCLKKPSTLSHTQMCSITLTGGEVTQKPPEPLKQQSSKWHIIGLPYSHSARSTHVPKKCMKWYMQARSGLLLLCMYDGHTFVLLYIDSWEWRTQGAPLLTLHLNSCAKMAFNILYLNGSNYYCLHLL